MEMSTRISVNDPKKDPEDEPFLGDAPPPHKNTGIVGSQLTKIEMVKTITEDRKSIKQLKYEPVESNSDENSEDEDLESTKFKLQPENPLETKLLGFNSKALIALFILVLQNAGVALVGRSALTDRNIAVDTVVIVIEFCKFFIAFFGVLYENNLDFSIFKKHCYNRDSLKMAVPAVLYFIQNNLVLMSLERLPTAVFQVTYQCKLLTTAFFSVIWLGRSITRTQIGALILLTVGVAVVQTADVQPSTAQFTVSDQIAGFTYVVLACILSGVAGVYFEKVLKESKNQSIFFRNFQLAGFTLILGAPIVLYRRWDFFMDNGFTNNPQNQYTSLVWFLVALQAFGGFVVATVVKYADQVQKGFAVSFAIVLGSIASTILFHTHLAFLFWAGATLVVSSVYFYNFFNS